MNIYPVKLEYTANNGLPAVCEIRGIYNTPLNSDREIFVLVVSDCGVGPSVTNNIEKIATELRAIGITWSVLIEHYPADLLDDTDDSFDLVKLRWTTPHIASNPQWQRINRDVAEGLAGIKL